MTLSDSSHRFVWAISDFHMADPGVELESPWFRAFYILDGEFRLLLTPRSDADPVSLRMQRKGNDTGPTRLKVRFELGLVDSLGTDIQAQVLTHEFERDAKYGGETFLPRSRVLSSLSRGVLTLYCNVHGEESGNDVRVDFDYDRAAEELPVVEEKISADSAKVVRRLESKSFPPGFNVKFRKASGVLRILIYPLATPKEDMEVYAEILVGEELLLSHNHKFSKDEVTSLVFPDINASDVKKDHLKVRATVMDLKPVITTKNHVEKNEKAPRPVFEFTKQDLDIKARDGSFCCSSIPLMAHSPAIYHALKEDHWLHLGLKGRIDTPPSRVDRADLKVTRNAGGRTTVELPNLSKSALEIVCKFLMKDGQRLQMQRAEVDDVYEVGRVLRIQMVGDVCIAEYWKHNMTNDAVLDRLKFGASLSNEDHKDILTNICLEHIHRHMREILPSPGWMNFLAKNKDLAEIVLNHLRECEGQREII